MNKFSIAQMVCKYLPPILSQIVRTKIISTEEGERLSLSFKRKAFTGGFFIGNTDDFHALKFGVHGFFDWRNIILINEILRYQKGDIIEVGANIGTETVSLADIAKINSVNVIAFEPVPKNCEFLFTLKRENDFHNLRIINKLVAEEKGISFFNIPTGNNSGSGHICSENSKNKRESFEVTTLDSEFDKDRKCIAVLVDVEGFEYQVLQGGMNLIKKDKPFLIIEVNRNYLENRGGISIEKLQLFLTSLDYIPFYIDKLGIHKVDITNFSVKKNKNWICIPKEKMHLKKKLSNSIFFNAFNPFMSHRII